MCVCVEGGLLMVKEERMRLGSGSASILQGGKAGELRLHAG